MISLSENRGRDPRNPHEVSVLEAAVQIGFCRYVSTKLDAIPLLPPETQSALLINALSPVARLSNSNSHLKMVTMLLERGFNPNGVYCEGTVWTRFLTEMDRPPPPPPANWPAGRNYPTTFSIIREMLKHGADVNALCYEPGTAMDKSAAEIVKIWVWRDYLPELEEFLGSASHSLQGEGGDKPHRSPRGGFFKKIFGDKRGKSKV